MVLPLFLVPLHSPFMKFVIQFGVNRMFPILGIVVNKSIIEYPQRKKRNLQQKPVSNPFRSIHESSRSPEVAMDVSQAMRERNILALD
jgi:hypothetical protein